MGKIENWVLNRRFKKEQEKKARDELRPIEYAAEQETYRKERIKIAHERGRTKARQDTRGRMAKLEDVMGAINKSAEAGNMLIWGNKKGRSRRKEDNWW